MNSLASWIDRSLLDSIVTDLTSVEHLTDDFTNLMHHSAAPTQSLSHRDFNRQPQAGEIGASGHTEAQLAKFREALQKVSTRFQSSGLWKHGQEGGLDDHSSGKSATAVATAPLLSKRGVSFFVPPQGSLGTRIRALTDWLKSELPNIIHLFVIDFQGCLVSDQEPPSPVLAASVVLADASRRASRHLPGTAEGAMHTELSSSEKLSVMTADSVVLGSFSLAIVLPYALPSGSSERIRAALLRCINEDGSR